MNSNMEGELGSVGLEETWGSSRVWGQVMAGFSCWALLGGHRRFKWMIRGPEPGSAWVSKVHSLRTREVGQHDRNLCFTQDFVCLWLGLGTGQGLCCLICRSYSIIILSLFPPKSPENVHSADSMWCKERRHNVPAFYVLSEFCWAQWLWTTLKIFKCFSLGDGSSSLVLSFLIPHLLNG